MRDKWFADNRDLVKWGVLLTLARKEGITHILQVLYRRQDEWGGLAIDGTDEKIPTEVIRHFRDPLSVTRLDPAITIEVITDTLSSHDTYQLMVLNHLRTRSTSRSVVFLDPDTGLAPRHAALEHVRDADLSEIWRALQPGDLLVFYQHQTNRSGQPWIEPKKRQFALALDIPDGTVKVATGMQTARDVAFFYARRGAEGVA